MWDPKGSRLGPSKKMNIWGPSPVTWHWGGWGGDSGEVATTRVPPRSFASPKRGAGARLEIGMLRGRGVTLNENKKTALIIGFLVSWLLGVLVSWFRSFKVSTFQSCIASKTKRCKSSCNLRG